MRNKHLKKKAKKKIFLARSNSDEKTQHRVIGGHIWPPGLTKKICGMRPLTTSKPRKRNFFSFFFKLNLINELYIALGPQKGILLGGFIRGQMVLQWRPQCLIK